MAAIPHTPIAPVGHSYRGLTSGAARGCENAYAVATSISTNASSTGAT